MARTILSRHGGFQMGQVFKLVFLTSVLLLLQTACDRIEKLEGRTKSMDDNTKSMKETTAQMAGKMEEMAQTTQEMAQTTAQMNKQMAEMSQTTLGMSATTGDMKDVTSHMYPQVRTKETEDTRNKKMHLLNSAFGFGEKIAASSIYYQSFEFQFWNANQSYDTLEVRDRLFLDAANEFFKRLNDIYKKINPQEISPFNEDPETDNAEMAFHALALTMHMNNHHQEYIFKKSGEAFPLTSFYDLMKTALLKEFSNEDMKEHEKVFVTGINKQISLDLLRARFNMLLALSLDHMVSQNELKQLPFFQNPGTLLSAQVAKWTSGNWGKISLTSQFESANKATRADTLVRLDGALEVKAFIEQIEQKVVIDPLISHILNNLKEGSRPQMDTENSPRSLADSAEMEHEIQLYYTKISEIQKTPTQ